MHLGNRLAAGTALQAVGVLGNEVMQKAVSFEAGKGNMPCGRADGLASPERRACRDRRPALSGPRGAHEGHHVLGAC